MGGKLVKVDNNALSIEESILNEYNTLKAQAKPINDRIKEIENALKGELKDLVSETTKINDLTFVVGGGFYSYDFDLERFKAEHFDLYSQYLTPKQSKETYSIRGKGGK